MTRLLIAIFICLTICSTVHGEERIRIGVIVPLTGPIAPMGQAFSRGVAMYKKDVPSARAIDFVIEDGAYDSVRTLNAFHKLRAMDDVRAIVVWGNNPSDACTPVAESLGVPLIANSYNPNAKGRKHVITFGPSTRDLIQKAADAFIEWKAERPTAVSVQIGNAVIALDMLKEMLHGNLDVTFVSGDESDFKTIITKLKKKSIGSLLFFAGADQSITFVNQAVQLGYTPRLIGADTFGDRVFQKAVAGKLPEVVYPATAVTDDFIARLNQEPEGASQISEVASGYSIAALIDRSRSRFKSGVLEAVIAANTGGLPVEGIEAEVSDERGRHINAAGKIYAVRAP